MIAWTTRGGGGVGSARSFGNRGDHIIYSNDLSMWLPKSSRGAVERELWRPGIRLDYEILTSPTLHLLVIDLKWFGEAI